MWHKSKLEIALKDNLVKITIQRGVVAEEVVIDSRKKTQNGLFIAFCGENNDGHNYLRQAFENGAIMAIVQKIPDDFQNDDRLILVKDSNRALIDLATYARSIFSGKIIGITGSVGKTSIKEMLKTILNKNRVFASYGNLNNHIGLPLSLCNLSENYDYGILEMGMNNLGEIRFLTNIAKPHIAIISNIACAHIGNFKNEAEIALAKSEIFEAVVENGYAILNHDNKYFDFLKSEALKNNIKETNIITFGKEINSDIFLKSFEIIDETKSMVTLILNPIFGCIKKDSSYEINSINESVILNSTIAIAVLKILGENIEDYLEKFMQLTTPKGRGNIVKISKNNKSFTIIDDSYNANLASMISGLRFLEKLGQQNPKSRTVAIIGDMLELGNEAVDQHKSIAKYIKQFNVGKTLLVGDLTKNIINELPKEQIIGHFNNSFDLACEVNELVNDGDIILIKGSNGTKMNLIIEALGHI